MARRGPNQRLPIFSRSANRYRHNPQMARCPCHFRFQSSSRPHSRCSCSSTLNQEWLRDNSGFILTGAFWIAEITLGKVYLFQGLEFAGDREWFDAFLVVNVCCCIAASTMIILVGFVGYPLLRCKGGIAIVKILLGLTFFLLHLGMFISLKLTLPQEDSAIIWPYMRALLLLFIIAVGILVAVELICGLIRLYWFLTDPLVKESLQGSIDWVKNKYKAAKSYLASWT